MAAHNNDYSQLKANMDSMAQLFYSKMGEFEAELSQAATRKAPTSIAALNGDYQAFKSFVVNALGVLRAQVEALERGLDRLEMRSRQKILLVHGVPESKNEDTSTSVVAAIAVKCNLPDLCAADLRSSHRMGKPRTDKNSKPRPILVKFCEANTRNKVWDSKKGLKGSKITLSEFLTKPRHDVFMAAREYFGISSAWTQDGWIHVKTADGKKHKIETGSDLQSLYEKYPKPKA